MKVVSIDPDIMGGTPCFVGTRVPIQTLLDYVEAGDFIDEFLDGFPTVSRAQVVAYLEESNRLILEQATHACAAPAVIARHLFSFAIAASS